MTRARRICQLILVDLTMFALAVGYAVAQQPQPWAARIAELYSQSVVEIEVETATGSASGSGFFVDSVGTIVTNIHVVRSALSARVRLASGEEYDILGYYNFDAERDLIILRIPAVDVTPVVLGVLDNVEAGNPVVAIGNPLGQYTRSVTDGLVSRIEEEEGTLQLQHSAPISPGNSGGPLFDANGRVIGVNTSGYLEGAQNLNFAVPVNYVRGLLAAKGELHSMVELAQDLAFAETANEEDDGSRPEGLTGMYEIEFKRGGALGGSRIAAYTVLFEDPVGGITGVDLFRHRSGRYDLGQIDEGQTPAGSRDAEWWDGGIYYAVFVIEEGKLEGDAYLQDTPWAFEAQRLEYNRYEISGLYDLDVISGDSVRSRMSLALFQFESSPEWVYGGGHIWRSDERGRVIRRVLRFTRGTVGEDSVTLEDESRTVRLALVGHLEGVRGEIVNTSTGEAFNIVGTKRGQPPFPDGCLPSLEIRVLEARLESLTEQYDSISAWLRTEVGPKVSSAERIAALRRQPEMEAEIQSVEAELEAASEAPENDICRSFLQDLDRLSRSRRGRLTIWPSF